MVYVSPRCDACAHARTLAAAVAHRFPGVEVRVVTLDEETGACLPDGVFAVPTYVLDGRVLWLGNPEPEAIERVLAQITASEEE